MTHHEYMIASGFDQKRCADIYVHPRRFIVLDGLEVHQRSLKKLIGYIYYRKKYASIELRRSGFRFCSDLDR